MAVDRAIALLPREEGNIRLIREECLRVLADTPVATTAPSIPAGGNTNTSQTGRAADEHTGAGSDRRTAAQVLLLHIDTALSFLSGAESGSGRNRDALPCTTFQQFVER